MLAFLPAWLRAPLALLLVALNTLLHTLPLFALALLKALLPLPVWRRACSRGLARIAESWIAVNSGLFALLTRTRFRIEGAEHLQGAGNCLVLANHQSWVDIPVLQKVFNRRIPFMRFFLKQQLLWVPVLGLAWWALDFPFMRRHSRASLQKHPELRDADVAATRRACARFRGLPVAVMNFVEGTRFTAAKHARQNSPYRHLLRPKAGGTAFVLETLGDTLDSVLDVTIVYAGGIPRMRDLLAGAIREVRVHTRRLPVPRELTGDYAGDAASRVRAQQWINALWAEKDALIDRLRTEMAGRTSAANGGPP